MATSIEDDDVLYHISEDLAEEILQRLPVESLLRFKCVRKSWYALISSCSFISRHFNYHGKNEQPKLLIQGDKATDDSIVSVTLISNKIKGTPLFEKPDHLQGFGGRLSMVGPVDGLFLFVKGNTAYDRRLRLWNPATRVVTILPAAPFPLQPTFEEMCSFFGFGLDPITSNYKVIWVRQFWDKDGNNLSFRAYAAVYSCSTDSWRVLEPKHHKVLTSFLGVCMYPNAPGYLNGSYYWMLRAEDYRNLLSFDFRNEVFSEIRGPPDVAHITCRSMMLRDGSITLLARGLNADFALWVMIKPGVWNKLLTFQCLSLVGPMYFGFWDSTRVIFLTQNFGLISYDVMTQEIRHLGFEEQLHGLMVYYYQESLVTIKPGNRELDRPM